MMLNRLNNTQLNIVIGVVMLLATFLGYFYTNDTFLVSALWPAAGFSVGFYYIYQNKSLPGIFFGILIARLISRFILFDEEIYITLLFPFVFTSANVLQAYWFSKIMEATEKIRVLTIKTAAMFLFTAIATSMIGAVISVSIIYLTSNCPDFLTTFMRWSFGDLAGILIFGPVVIFSSFFDTEYKDSMKKNIQGLLFLLLFILFAYAIFSDTISWLSFHDYSFLFMFFFFIPAFIFRYRMILVINSVYILMYQLLLINTVSSNELGLYIFSLNLCLYVLSTIALITKYILNDLEEGNKSLKESNIKFANLVDSTNTLLKLSDDLLKPETSVSTDYLKRMFEIATNLFHSFDTASCFVWGVEKPTFVAAIGYDCDELNTYDFDIANFKIDIFTP